MVDLRDDRETAVVKALDDHHFPHRLRAVDLLGHQAPGDPLQLLVGAGPRKGDVANVVVDVEVLIIDPDWVLLDRHPHDPLAIPRNHVHLRRYEVLQPLDVDATIRLRKRPGTEDRDRTNVHVRRPRLEREKRVVQRREPFIVDRHDSS